jgi:hypothetical protein
MANKSAYGANVSECNGKCNVKYFFMEKSISESK